MIRYSLCVAFAVVALAACSKDDAASTPSMLHRRRPRRLVLPLVGRRSDVVTNVEVNAEMAGKDGMRGLVPSFVTATPGVPPHPRAAGAFR